MLYNISIRVLVKQGGIRMNIYVQCCAYAIMFVLFISYIRQKRLHLCTEKAFVCVFMSTKICILLDIASIVAMYYADSLPKVFVEILCKTYLLSVLVTAFLGLMYVCVDIYRKSYPSRILAFKYGIFMLIGAGLVIVLPIYICEESNGLLYICGPGSLATYAFSLCFLVINLVEIVIQKKKITPKRREAVLIWMGLWAGSAFIQCFIDRFMVVSFAGALGILVMYLKLENPMTNIERESGLFSQTAFMEYVKELYDNKKQFAVASFVFDRTLVKLFRTQEGRLIAREGIRYLFDCKGVKSFRKAEDEIILVFEELETAEKKCEEMFERLHQGWGAEKSVLVKTYWMYLPNSNMVKDADELFYLLKHAAMNIKERSEEEFVHIGASMIEEMYKKMEMEMLIDDALENDRIEVYYQPIYSTVDKHFTTAEALVRIKDKEGNIVSPGEFIPVAEENGKIIQIGERVFEKVCTFIKEHDITKYGMKYIEVNLSVVQCADEKLAEKYIRIIKDKDILPEYINLEITESASVKAKKVLLENMEKLMEEGVHFSLDDFGTGQSNLNYIVDMPVALVKFDRDMTNAYFDNQKAKHVMDAAMHMIHGMELKIVSEGIETEKQFKVMEDLGIGYIQGYYFSKPLPEKEFLEFMKNNHLV